MFLHKFGYCLEAFTLRLRLMFKICEEQIFYLKQNVGISFYYILGLQCKDLDA